jgi:eukaryotic-like serine/threonine-protein kinase
VAALPERLQRGLADRYRIERELGRGGMATVFLAHDLRHDRPVALKVLHPELAATLGPARFQREIKVAARLQHPHILTVHDSGEAAGQLWYTMPFVRGESLRDRLQREGQLPIDVAVDLARQVALALDYAHREGVVHRDLKPENILLSEGQALVADFGIAKALSAAGDAQLTETGMAVGTPTYMAPEQALGGQIDGRSDVYGLGCVVYEMLAGEPPFSGATPQALIAKRVLEPAPHVRTVRDTVSVSMEQALLRALAKTPADRFSTAGDFARALEATPGISTPPLQVLASAEVRRLRWTPTTAITLMLVMLIAVAALFAWRQSHSVAGETGYAKVLAVLPFENLGDSADAYFADGVADGVRTKLSQVVGIEVIARTSSNEYRRTTKNAEQIAHELGVAFLLNATLQWEKRPGGVSRVRVTPELVEVTPGRTPRTRWGQQFDASITDVFEVQADIAGRVAEALGIALDTRERRALSERPTANLAAYDAFLQGEQAASGLGTVQPSAVRRAVAAYERAVQTDSAFVPAWSQLSRALSHLSYFADPSPTVQRRARSAAAHAVQLAPDRPEGWIALGDVSAKIDNDPTQALDHYARARRLGAKGPEVLTSSAFAERILGQWDSVESHLREAHSIDPRSVEVARTLGETLILLRKYPEALRICEHALTLAPRNLTLISSKAVIYLAQGDLPRAREWIEVAKSRVDRDALAAFFGAYGDLYWALDPNDQHQILKLRPEAFDGRKSWAEVLAQVYHLHGDSIRAAAYADSALQVTDPDCGADAQCHALKAVQLALAGRSEEAIREGELGQRIAPVSKDAYMGPYVLHELARAYLLTGRDAEALRALELLVRVPYYVSRDWLRIDPAFASLGSNPRFERLVNGP